MAGDTTGEDAEIALRRYLSDRESDPILIVLDNFETIHDQSAVYEWFSNVVRLPHKVLITTRFREFKGDYPIEVGGMNRAEFQALVQQTLAAMGRSDLTKDIDAEDFRQTIAGHPYMAKLLLGQAAQEGGLPSPKQYLAQSDQLLEALFDRTYNHLNALERRAFLTLANWRSSVLRLALLSVLADAGPDAADKAIDRLTDFSMVDRVVSSEDGQQWLSVPLAGSVFGKRKLTVDPLQLEIKRDSELLQSFGALAGSASSQSLVGALRRVTGAAAVAEDPGDLVEMLLFVARSYPEAWLSVAELSSEIGETAGLPSEAAALENYLQSQPTNEDAWRRLQRLHYDRGDARAEAATLMQIIELPSADLDDFSLAANRLNALHNRLNDRDIGQSLARRVIELMEGVIDQYGSADDRSRIAWLYVRTRDSDSAREHVAKGLELDPSNSHCLKLAQRLELGDGE